MLTPTYPHNDIANDRRLINYNKMNGRDISWNPFVCESVEKWLTLKIRVALWTRGKDGRGQRQGRREKWLLLELQIYLEFNGGLTKIQFTVFCTVG